MIVYCFSHFLKAEKNQKTHSFIGPYAQKSSTVSNLEMSRRLACHVLLLSFLKNHRDHLLGENRKKRIYNKCNKPPVKHEVTKSNKSHWVSKQSSHLWLHLCETLYSILRTQSHVKHTGFSIMIWTCFATSGWCVFLLKKQQIQSTLISTFV